MKPKRIVIVGAGAVGGSIGGLLARNHSPVALVARGEHGQAIKESGLVLHCPNQSFSVRTECFHQIEDVNWQEGDVAVLSTKLNDAQEALDHLLVSAGPELPIVCATNGIHGEIWAKERFQHVISMMIWMPTTYLIPGEVNIYGGDYPGVLDCGEVESADHVAASVAEELCDHLSRAGFHSCYRKDISRWKLAKLITNLANTAQALVADDWNSVAKAAQIEGTQILELAGWNHVSAEELRERTRCVNLLPVNGKKRPGGSTWQSLQRGKPLESPWLEGAIVELAEQYDGSVPINRTLRDAGKTLQKLTVKDVLK